MSTSKKLKIVIVTAYYSEGMGYSENCLSRALARLGHEVHVVTSTFNVYGNSPSYDEIYREFLGPRQLEPGSRTVDGYQLHRLESDLVGGYVRIKGLTGKIRELSPDVVHSLELASLQTFELAAAKPFLGYKLFSETHQTMSVVKPYMLQPQGAWLKKAGYRLTRTLPSFLSSFALERCYAVTPDCGEVATRFYGLQPSKMVFLSLGADTETFHPIENESERIARRELRERLGYTDEDIVCVYTGRFTLAKNPLLLARTIAALSQTDPRFKALFIGNGVQRDDIAACPNTTIVPFMTHDKLAEHYRAADIGVWPREESMSMIDAAASGVPVVVTNRIGEPARVIGNGKMYEENDIASLADVLRSFARAEERLAYGSEGRRKMLAGKSWATFARTIEADFLASFGD
jgi:glycosyltransferase involved in cell wall biosynthesis